MLSPKITSVDVIAFSSLLFSLVSSSFSSVPFDIFLVNIPPTVNPPCSSPSVPLAVFETFFLKYDVLEVDIISCSVTPKFVSSSVFTFIFVAFNKTASVNFFAISVEPKSSTIQLAYPKAVLELSVSYTYPTSNGFIPYNANILFTFGKSFCSE